MFLILLALLLFCSCSEATTLEILHSNLNDSAANTTVAEVSKKLNNGTLTGANTQDITTSGKIGSALDFNGFAATDYISYGDQAYYSATDGSGTDSAISFVAWINPDTITDNNYILSKQSGTTVEYNLSVQSDGEVYIAFFDNGGASARIGKKTSGAGIAAGGGWYFVVATYTGSEVEGGIKIFVNNVEQSLASFSTGTYNGMANTTVEFEVARVRGTGSTVYFDGQIDCVRVYDFALNTQEMNFLWNNGGGTELPLQRNFNMLTGGATAITFKGGGATNITVKP